MILENIPASGSSLFASLWPRLLEELHVTRTELANIAWSMHTRGELVVKNLGPRERSVKDHHALSRK